MLNSIPDGVATTDATGQLTYTNLPMAAILGMKDIVGATDANYGAEQRPKMTDLLDRSAGSSRRAMRCSRPRIAIGRSSPN